MRIFEGQVELFDGNLDAAEAALEGLTELLLGRRAWFAAATAAYVRGGVALARGDVDGGVEWLRRACDDFVTCGDVCSLDAATADLAQAEALAGREREAAAACERALACAPDRPLGERNTHLMHECAIAAARAGRAEDAAEYVAAAAVAARRDPVIIGRWHAPAASGDVTLFAGDPDRARERYREALALAADITEERGPSLPAAMYLMASELRLAQTAADRQAALGHARAALEHAQASGAPGGVAAARMTVQQLEAVAAE